MRDGPLTFGGIEVGGTHVSSARIILRSDAADLVDLRRADLPLDASRDELLACIVATASHAADPSIAAWGVAVPGPFDYARGISRIRGVAKLDGLYGVDLRRELAVALHVRSPELIRFINDADAFLVGEAFAGAARGHRRAIGLTLGTGLGSAFLRDGGIVETGPGVPPEGRLDLAPFRGGAIEDLISRRGLLSAYARAGADVIDIAGRARAGEAAGREVFARFGAALGEFMAPWLLAFAPTALVIGGSIARSWDLFAEAFRQACPPALDLASCGVAERLEEAALLGATVHAWRDL
ncbi:MAG: ROK family protein [Chloroflexota bacterium]|nr:ROK family protein [Chloroflexota bacterium]